MESLLYVQRSENLSKYKARLEPATFYSAHRSPNHLLHHRCSTVAAQLPIITPRACARVKQSSVVVFGTKIARSRVLGVCASYKHNQSVDIGEKHALNCSKSATNRALSIQHACGISTTPTLLA